MRRHRAHYDVIVMCKSTRLKKIKKTQNTKLFGVLSSLSPKSKTSGKANEPTFHTDLSLPALGYPQTTKRACDPGGHYWDYCSGALYSGQTIMKDQSHKSHNVSVPYPTIHHSEQKCAHFCSEWCIVGYGISALWDL